MTEEKTLPHRVQLKRTKGWRIPENTAICDRRSVWGNPYKIIVRDKKNNEYICMCDTGSCIGSHESVMRYSLDTYWFMIRDMQRDKRREWLQPLLGKNLACWCSEQSECHCDVLFKWLKIEFGQEYEMK